MDGKKGLHYLALGDSYTIGEGLPFSGNYPSQLLEQLRSKGIDMQKPTVIARTGWTTGDLQEGIRKSFLEKKYDLVTLLIGVNNQYQGLSLDEYRGDFRNLLGLAIHLAGDDTSRVIVLSIPDYSVTPFAINSLGRASIAKELDAFNEANKSISSEMKVNYLDITEESRKAGLDASLLVADGLHYSALEYRRWAGAMLPMAERILR